MTCPRCGHTLAIGDYPFCKGEARHHAPQAVAIARDDIPGGMTLENYGPDPITVYSHSERRALMRQRGLTERESFAPMPGTDKDAQGIPNPNGYRDLSAAAILMRNGRGRVADPGLVGGDPLDPADRFDIPNRPGEWSEPLATPFTHGMDHPDVGRLLEILNGRDESLDA